MSIAGVSASSSLYASAPAVRQQAPDGAAGDQPDAAAEAKAPAPTTDSTTLSKEALDQISRLQARDREVRQHEQSHMAASGGLASSGPTFTYQRGPDGVNYAIGGEVNIDVSPGRTPEETIALARTIQAAALAPPDPSGPDRAVAAQARQMEQDARTELALKQVDSAPQAPGQRLREDVKKSYGSSDPQQAQGRIDLYA